jgi:hypothetical protein
MNAPRDIRDSQHTLLSGELYEQIVTATHVVLRHKSEYDVGTDEDRRFALLCWVLQRSADGASCTSINLAGVYRVLNQIIESGEVR